MMMQEWPMDDRDILAGAKFYARAAATRAVSGVIPEWDDEADNANWRRTRPDVRAGCLDMVRGIVAAAGFRLAQEAAGKRANSDPRSRRRARKITSANESCRTER